MAHLQTHTCTWS